MLTNDDLQAIKGIIKEEIDPLKEQLENVEMKVEVVNKRVEQAQEETINALSQLIQQGYNTHEKRIKKIEEQLQPTQAQ